MQMQMQMQMKMKGDKEEQKHNVLNGKYELGRLLGQGTFARVYQARNLDTGKSVAMKVIAKDKVVKSGMMEQMKREISVMKRVKHPNIVQLYEVMATKSNIYLSMELVHGGDGQLLTKVSKGGKLNEDSARSYFRQLISAVDFCHTQGVYHRDLKLENLLVDDKGNLKITDFGLSTFNTTQNLLLRTTCGTPHYVAPEVISRKGQGYHGSKADIWSCGIILFVLLAGFYPFHDENLIRMYRRIYKADFNCPSWFSTEAHSLIIQMLDSNPDTRIPVSQIVQSNWYSMTTTTTTTTYEDLNLNLKNKLDLSLMDEPETLNAFHLISLSQGFDLSPLFEVEDKMRFATTQSATAVVSRLHQLAANFSFDKAAADSATTTIKAPLAIVAHLFSVSPTLLMVEVTKHHGNTLEYNHFCTNLLGLTLEYNDIVWTSPSQYNPTYASASSSA